MTDGHIGWSDERTAELKKRWRDGQSASEIAEALGGGVTRNGVIGKVHRLGLTGACRDNPAAPGRTTIASRIKAPTVPRARAWAPKPGPHNKPGAIFGAIKHETDFTKAEIARAKRTEAGVAKVAQVSAGAGVESPGAVPMLDYVRGCKWPIGERGAVHYCCNPIAGGDGWGRRYCAGHYALSISDQQPQTLRPRDAGRLTRFDRVERDTPRPSPERTLWDDAREAA